MRIEQQVVSLELAKQLKAAGYPQDYSYWSWAISSTIFSCPKCDYEEERFPQLVNTIQCIGPAFSETIAAAPTVAELGEKLRGFNIVYGFRDDLAWVNYDTGVMWSECNSGKKICTADTEADARCKMVLYLLEKGLL